MTNKYANQILAQYLQNKLAADHEGMESPDTEMLEHALGGQGEGTGEDEAEQMLSQLSPEELQELAASLSGEMQDPSQSAGGEDVEALAQAIQQNLSQNPEASVAGLPPEKAAALTMLKSAAYIEGFLGQALNNGLDVKQAVDIYDQALTETVESLHKTSALTREGRAQMAAIDASKKGTRKAVGRAGKRVANAVGGAAASVGSRMKGKGKYIAGGAALLGAGALALSRNKKKNEDASEEKKAAYLEGVYKRALDYGFSEHEALQLTEECISKQAAVTDAAGRAAIRSYDSGKRGIRAGIERFKRSAGHSLEHLKGRAGELKETASKHKEKVLEHLKDKKKYYYGGAGALAAGGIGAAALSGKKDKSEE